MTTFNASRLASMPEDQLKDQARDLGLTVRGRFNRDKLIDRIKAKIEEGNGQATPKRQQQFEGEGFPERPPKRLLDARDAYLDKMRRAANASAKKKEAKQDLIDLMDELGFARIPLDDGSNKFFEIEHPGRITTKTMDKSLRDGDDTPVFED